MKTKLGRIFAVCVLLLVLAMTGCASEPADTDDVADGAEPADTVESMEFSFCSGAGMDYPISGDGGWNDYRHL